MLVALQDALLDNSFDEFVKQYPLLKFRKVGVDLSRGDYADVIARRFAELDGKIVICEACSFPPLILYRSYIYK